MKIALVFTGISHGIGREFQHCFPNHDQQLIQPLSNHQLSIFATTYTHEFTDELINLYKPIAYKFLPYDNSHQVLTYIESMNLLTNKDFDFVISTRYDIHFHKNINDFNLDYSKFNALFKEKGWWDNMKFTTDNFFAFPYSMLNTFISTLHGLYKNPSRATCMDLHQMFYRMQTQVGQQNTHIASNLDELSNYNSFYSLCSSKWGKQ